MPGRTGDDGEPIEVLAVATYPQLGGGEILMVDVLAGLADRGVRPSVLVFGEGPIVERCRSAGLVTVVAPPLHLSRPRAALRSLREARRAAGAIRVDVVHASNPKAQLVAWVLRPGRQVGRTVQLLDPPGPRDLYALVTAALPAHRTAITPDAAAAWRRRTGRRIRTVVPGVDGEALAARAAVGDPDLAWAGLLGERRVAMVARHQRYKGGADLVEAVARIDPSRRPAVAVIGPDEPLEPGVRSELEALVGRLGLDPWVRIHGALSDPDVAAAIARADLLVHPAHHETFGLVVAEALALGTPVLAASAPGPRHLLASGGGRLVRIGHVSGLAAALDEMLAEAPVPTTRAATGGVGPVSGGGDGAYEQMLAGYHELFTTAARR